MTALPDGLTEYFLERQRERNREVEMTYAAMNPRERRLVREAAVMGYVRGVMAGESNAALRKPGDWSSTPIPRDSAIVHLVIDSTFSFPESYPFMNRMNATAHRRADRAATPPQ